MTNSFYDRTNYSVLTWKNKTIKTWLVNDVCYLLSAKFIDDCYCIAPSSLQLVRIACWIFTYPRALPISVPQKRTFPFSSTVRILSEHLALFGALKHTYFFRHRDCELVVNFILSTVLIFAAQKWAASVILTFLETIITHSWKPVLISGLNFQSLVQISAEYCRLFAVITNFDNFIHIWTPFISRRIIQNT